MADEMVFRSIEDIERVARHAAESGLTQHRRLPAAVTVLLTGRELGLQPMAALRSIHEVNGRPVLSADAMVAIVRRSGLCASWRIVESTTERATIATLRRGEEEPQTCTWTLEDARRAGCTGPSWAKFPRQMLRHRAETELARAVYPDVILGLYTPDELGGEALEEETASSAPSARAPAPAPSPSPSSEQVVDAVLEAPAGDCGLVVDGVSWDEALECVEVPGKAVAVWLSYRGAIAQLPADQGRACWDAIVQRVAVTGRMAARAAATWLKTELASELVRQAES